jgi:hypothetical protein
MMRRLFIAMLLGAAALFLRVPPAPAGQAAQGNPNPPAATGEKSQAAEPACPGMASGTCCGGCMQGQGAAAQGAQAGQPPAECPCGKMKKGDLPTS